MTEPARKLPAAPDPTDRGPTNFWPTAVDGKLDLQHLAKSSFDLAKGRTLLFQRSLIFTAEIPVDGREARRLLPFGVRLANPGTAIVFAADHKQPCFAHRYQEVAVMLRVRSIVGPGLLIVWMLVNDDSALIYGREVLGVPKKMAAITVTEEANRFVAQADRRGERIFELAVTKGELTSPVEPVFAQPIAAVGGLGQAFAWNLAWASKSPETIHWARTGDAKVHFAPSAYDPIRRLFPDLTPVSARIVEVDVRAAPLLYPIGVAGLKFFMRNYNLRLR